MSDGIRWNGRRKTREKRMVEEAKHITKEEYIKAREEYEKNVVSKLPRINTENMSDIINFLDSHIRIRTKKEANIVLEYFDSLKEEWMEYRHTQWGTDVFPRIYTCMASAYQKLRQTDKAIQILQECLSLLCNDSWYDYRFATKAGIYQNLAILYFELDDVIQTRINMRKAIFQLFAKSNNISYDNFAFYAFRPLSKYVIEGIRENKISLSNPTTFNDPVDPALITHFELHIQLEKRAKENEFLRLQQDIYKEFRIACLSRSAPLPTEKTQGPSEHDPQFKELHQATMWGYYAKSHTGICIKYVFPSSFTKNELWKNGEVLMLRNVDYKNTYNPRKDRFNYIDAFFSKGKAWKHEGECRLTYFKEDGTDSDFPWINLPEGCIREIYIGYKASTRAKKKLKGALVNQPQVKLYQMQPSKKNIYYFEAIEIQLSAL